jgi:hypothetical protein
MRRYRTPEAFRQALAGRLTRYADEQRISFEVVRRRLVFQRLLSLTEQPVAKDVRVALEAVFHAYGTHALPSTLPPTPAQWARDYRGMIELLGLPADLARADAMAGEFVNPVLTSAARGQWNRARRQWSS